ncbi:MAG: glycosyltransferase family 4 protein [bacterium]|nr:glycosyltransferase family 4 protein [bacterium]
MSCIKILMLGPARNVKGGISTLVNNYFNAGLLSFVDCKYIGTMIDRGTLLKLFIALKALVQFLFLVWSYDIIHLHMASGSSFYRKAVFARLSILFKKKLIIHIHGAKFKEFFHEDSSERRKKLIRHILNSANLIIALSESWKITLQGITDTPVTVLYNSIEVCPENNNKDYSLKNVSFFGRLGQRKGVYDLISILPDLLKKHNDAVFYICGDGDIDEIRKICKKYIVNGQIHIPGWVDKKVKEQILNLTTVFVLPSYYEGLPMAMLEAMAHGIAIVSTCVGGIPELVKEGYNGFILFPGDKENLLFSLERLLDSYELRKNMGNNSYKMIDEKFDIKRNLEQLFHIYKGIKT